jgi:hypothetical protein
MHATDYRSLIWVLILGLAPATALARTSKKVNKSTTSDSGVEAGKTSAPAGGVESEASQSSVPQPVGATPTMMSPAPDSSVPAAQPQAPVGPAPLESGPTALKGKWNPTFYGFIEIDAIHDSTQSFANGCPGYFLIARPGTYAGDHGRTIFDARGSRFGFKLAAPEAYGMKATAVLEMDFAGNQMPTNYGANANGISEGATYSNPLIRIRHAAIKLESEYVDLLAGQYWQLFGWAPLFLPVTVQIPGFPGVPYGRSVQFRLSHVFRTQLIGVEVALAAARPPQRNSEYPDAQGGVRVLLNGWTGAFALGATGGAFLEMPASIGVSGAFRRLRVSEFVAEPHGQNDINVGGISIDVFLPVIPSSLEDKGNALNLTANYTNGRGIADLYTPGTMGGAGFPPLPNPNAVSPAPTWPQDIDNGLVTYQQQSGVLHAIEWQTFMVGGQYYFPPSGRVWIAANYGYASSANIASYDLVPAQIVTKYTLWDAVAYVNVTGPVNVACEFAHITDTYGDGHLATNNRFMLSGYYSFY